jgi:hypothetical protein
MWLRQQGKQGCCHSRIALTRQLATMIADICPGVLVLPAVSHHGVASDTTSTNATF